ncbi:hypothetical protein CERSUDRAFT_84404 [Gelatoporia subvermispora B]|uniref:Glucose-methanol-choline oxidoreductase N-terminal domain-containing protein n=1 Tax=Ceriporiopsis subvermispora (strain B) TaxID=914234 RepID=M2QW43_CERS8|nr:hypothetical protein CERSUDRAFT_84404 [Gelatoporia subvermispora B]
MPVRHSAAAASTDLGVRVPRVVPCRPLLDFSPKNPVSICRHRFALTRSTKHSHIRRAWSCLCSPPRLSITNMGAVASSQLKDSPSVYATKIPETGQDSTATKSSIDVNGWNQYDYVIVGGGTAGCVIASRLSEDPNVRVLILEAGRGHNSGLLDLTHLPIGFLQLYRTEVDWNFETIPQAHADNRQVYFPRGKLLGGCSGTNAAIFHHCAPEDFDEWERKGAAGWNYATMIRYLLKVEKYLPNSAYRDVDASHRGSEGRIFTKKSEEIPPVNKTVLEACQNLGIPYTEDLNTRKGTLGATEFMGTVDAKGSRSSTATAYLTPDVLARPNLTVGVHVRAERIIFTDIDGTSRASGVILASSATGARYGVLASREVVMCAGSVATPQLLMLSGLGPSAHLQDLGVTVVKDLPHVGQNLADHIATGSLVFRAKPGTNISLDYLAKPLNGAIALLKWLLTGRGPMSCIAAAAAAFIRSDDPALKEAFSSNASANVPVRDRTSGPGAPDIEITWGAIVSLDNGFKKPPPGCEGLTFSAIALRPESTGSIRLASRSVWDAPVIDANYLASENDVNVLARGARLIMRLTRMEPLAELLEFKLVADESGEDVFWPGNTDPDEVSDEALQAWIRKHACPVFHPVSTARIGTNAENSVVDAMLNVHGVLGLRVVDASVFPTQLSGHPCAVVAAMAERAVELMQEER